MVGLIDTIKASVNMWGKEVKKRLGAGVYPKGTIKKAA